MGETETETVTVTGAAFLFRGGELVLPAEGRASFSPDALSGLEPEARRLYRAGGLLCEALRLPADAALPAALGSGARALLFRAALGELPAEEAGRAAKGLALLNWLSVSAHCGACGAALEDDAVEGLKAGARKCPSCGRVFYPRISPAVIVLIRKKGKVLLAHNASFPAGRFGLIAGFVEAGEGLEEAARREIREETGIEVGELSYRCSQPWPFPDSLMVAFETDWLSGEARPDGEELTELRWCGPEELPSIPPPGSVARRLIDDFVAAARSTSCGGGAS